MNRSTPLRRMSLSTLPLVGLALFGPALSSAQISTVFSYYVPQAGSVGTPLEGTAARAFFRACPNNDGGGCLPNNARVKIVVRDLSGFPMVGIRADSICAQFVPADSDTIVAGSPCDTTCPHIECLAADAPTDINGVTYITFIGALSTNPGVGVRNPNHKWGHYGTIPVRVKDPTSGSWVTLLGRLTTASANGSYVLQIKNLDVVGGIKLPCHPGEGESVDASDLAALAFCLGGCPMAFWLDFDWNGTIGPSDVNLFLSHLGHNCTTPLNP